MTVDEKAFFQYASSQPEKVAEHILAVREVTGIAEDDEIRRALDKTRDTSGDYNLSRAVDLLLGAPSPAPMAPLPPATVLPPPPPAIGPQELKHKVYKRILNVEQDLLIVEMHSKIAPLFMKYPHYLQFYEALQKILMSWVGCQPERLGPSQSFIQKKPQMLVS